MLCAISSLSLLLLSMSVGCKGAIGYGAVTDLMEEVVEGNILDLERTVVVGSGDNGSSEVTLMADDGPEAGVEVLKSCLDVGRVWQLLFDRRRVIFCVRCDNELDNRCIDLRRRSYIYIYKQKWV